MNETELDELLDQWKMSGPPDSLREDVRASFVRRPVRRQWSLSSGAWRGIFAGTAFAAVLFLAAMTSAYSQTALWFGIQLDRPSWILESNEISYSPDGSALGEYPVTYVLVDGQQIALSDDPPDLPPWRRALSGMESVFVSIRLQVAPSTVIQHMSPAGDAAWRSFVERGCVENPADPSTLIGHETILGHPTAINRSTMPHAGPTRKNKLRFTTWRAPDLKCAVLKSTYESGGPDEPMHLVSATIPLRITANAVRGGVASKK